MKAVADTLAVARSNLIERVNRRAKWRRPYRKAGDNELLALIRRLGDERPTYGYRRIRRLPVEWLSRSTPQLPWASVCFTPVRSPESNGIAEAFVKTFKRDYARLSILPDAETVIALLPAWFEDYNEVHPHSGLKFLSPREFQRLSA